MESSSQCCNVGIMKNIEKCNFFWGVFLLVFLKTTYVILVSLIASLVIVYLKTNIVAGRIVADNSPYIYIYITI